MKEKQTGGMGPGKRLLWTLLFLLIAALTIWTVTAQNKNFTLAQLWGQVSQGRPVWLAGAVLSMVLYISLGAAAILYLLRGFGYRRSPLHGLSYTAADLYFSAITPSATGGQPAAAFFMAKDGVPVLVTTVVLLANLMCYTLSILVIGFLSFVIRPGTFLQFGGLSKALILFGCVVQVLLALFYCMLLWNKTLLRRIGDVLLHLLARLRLLKNADRLEARFHSAMDRYGAYTALLRDKKKYLWRAFWINLAHRASQIAVTALCYLSMGGEVRRVVELFTIQSSVVLGSNSIPIPGAMGVTDYLMLDAFGSIMDEARAANLELLSRSVSFYSLIIICGVIVLIRSGMMRIGREKT